MARIKIVTTSTGPALFSTGGGGASVTIELDEALPPEDFTNGVGALTQSANLILAALAPEEEPRTPTIITVPDDQVQAVSDLNSGTDHPDGLLIIPASARRINFSTEEADDGR